MTEQIESICRRVSWKLFFFKNPDQSAQKNTFGFRSTNRPPYDEDLKLFEKEMFSLLKRIKFRPVQNEFQRNLRKKMREINNSDKVVVPSDKTGNHYLVSAHDYMKLLHDNITKDYAKVDDTVVSSVNEEAAVITRKLQIADRVDYTSH